MNIYKSGSVGCVGILKNWLTRSLRVALAESATTLTTSHLKQGAFGASRINKIRSEAQRRVNVVYLSQKVCLFS